jgi:hypothetical protein
VTALIVSALKRFAVRREVSSAQEAPAERPVTETVAA